MKTCNHFVGYEHDYDSLFCFRLSNLNIHIVNSLNNYKCDTEDDVESSYYQFNYCPI